MLHYRTSALLLLAAATACGGPVNTTPVSSFIAATPTPAPATPAPGATPTPIPVNTPTPTPGPAGVLTAGPATLGFTSATAAAQSTTVGETGYNGTFTQTNTCASIAAVSSTTSTGPQASFTVAPQGGGTCVVTFTDASGQTATVNVTVTTSALNLNSIERERAR